MGTLGLELPPDELPSSRLIPEPPSLPFNALLSIQIVHKAQVSHSEPASLCIPLSAPSSRSRKQAACRREAVFSLLAPDDPLSQAGHGCCPLRARSGGCPRRAGVS